MRILKPSKEICMKLVPNSKDYYVSEDGFVFRNGKKLHTNRATYYTVRIVFTDGTHKDFYVHRLVAMLYIPNPENKRVVNHKDGNKQNNRVENLEWCTHKENSQHASQNGLIGRGPSSPTAELSSWQVHAICRRLMQGYRVKDIAEEFKISQPVVSSIKNKTRYTDIASKYTFPPKSRALSIETVMWICSMMELGKKNKEIEDMYDGTFYAGCLDMIRYRRAYKDISIDFNF